MGNSVDIIQYTKGPITNTTQEQINDTLSLIEYEKTKGALSQLIKEKHNIERAISYYLNEIKKNEKSRNMLSLQKLTILDEYKTYKHHDTINKQEYNAYCLKLDKNTSDILEQEKRVIEPLNKKLSKLYQDLLQT